MERLTKRCRGMVWYSANIGDIVERLAAYEDTGLMPEEIMGLCDMHERAKMADLLRLEEYQQIGTVEEIRRLVDATESLVAELHRLNKENFWLTNGGAHEKK